MKISIFGNPDLPSDALPIKILPELKRLFPKINFIIEDPNELNLPSKDWLIIDTVENIKSVKVINLDRVEKIKKSSASLHDFDLGMHLLWIQKIQKNVNIKIIGVPPKITEKEAVNEISRILANLLSKNGQHSSCMDHMP